VLQIVQVVGAAGGWKQQAARVQEVP